jgi:Spy/CpxP family protein refolding chaperone
MLRTAPWSLVLTLGLCGAGVAAAQEPPRPREGERRPERDGPTDEEPTRTRGGPPWANSNWTGEAVDWLGRELDLDPSQREKVEKILQNQVADMMKKAAELWNPEQGGMPDYNKMRGAFEDVRIGIAEKINEVLTPEQRLEFEQIVDQFDRRSQSFEQRRRAAEDPTELFDPPPISKRILMSKAERALVLGPDETAAVMPLVERVLDLQVQLDEGRKTRRVDLRNAISGGAKDDEVRARLDALRQAEEFQRLELAAARHALREVLTVEQEVRFVTMGILD